MELSLPTLAKEILANPTWIEPYTSTDDPTQERATIKHAHWIISNTITANNPLFIHCPQPTNPNPFTLCDIPWNNNDPQLFTYLQQIVDDWQCLQQFLQTLQLYHQDCVQIPTDESLMYVDPLHPNYYTINNVDIGKTALFRIHPQKPSYYVNSKNLQSPPSPTIQDIAPTPILPPLPNRIPKTIIHAIQRLTNRQIIRWTNYSAYSNMLFDASNMLFTAYLLPNPHLSQHAIIQRIKHWQEYYPDIPISNI